MVLNYSGADIKVIDIKALERANKRLGNVSVADVEDFIEVYPVIGDIDIPIVSEYTIGNNIQVVNYDVFTPPPEKKGVVYLVHQEIAPLLKGRKDVFFPIDPAYDNNGEFIGYTRIARFNSWTL